MIVPASTTLRERWRRAILGERRLTEAVVVLYAQVGSEIETINAGTTLPFNSHSSPTLPAAVPEGLWVTSVGAEFGAEG